MEVQAHHAGPFALLDLDDGLTPIECQWTNAPTAHHARHLLTFLREHPSAPQADVVWRTPRRFALAPGVQAVPWQELPALLNT